MATPPVAPGPDVAPQTPAQGKPTNEQGEPIDKLTPVRPRPPQARQPAYQLYLEIDGPLITIAVAFSSGRAIRAGLAPAYCAPVAGMPVEETTECDPANLNWFDRQFAGRYQPKWGLWSDVGVYGIQALAAAGIVADEGWRAGLNDLVVVAEAAMLANAAAGASTAITGRPRPYMYGTAAPASVREDGTGGLSYFSSHTATSFAAATSAFVTLRRLHPDERWPWWAFAGGMATATFVGATRVLAGSHFPTDVLAGAAVGAAIGILMPALHSAPRKWAPVPLAVDSGGGVAVVGTLP